MCASDRKTLPLARKEEPANDQGMGGHSRRDARLLLPACGAWLAALLFDTQPKGLVVMCGLLLLLFLASGISFLIVTAGRRRMMASSLFFMSLVTLATVLAILVSCTAHQVLLAHDPLLAAGKAGERIEVELRVSSPPIASARRGSDCQYEAKPLRMRRDGVVRISHASLWVWGSGKACTVQRGEQILLRAKAGQPRYGNADVWLTVGKEARLMRTAKPGLLDSTVSDMWESFFEQCRRLPLQGRLLVPGMTVGVLGSQAVIPDQASVHLADGEEAARLTTIFKTVGIVHLLAVSGGHFALVGGWVHRRLGIWGVPAWVRGSGMALADLLLADILFPADSVLRAVAMALVSALAIGMGRPSQALSALCVSVIGLLLYKPSLSSSLGFALSCAAVLGILLLARPFEHLLSRAHMPRTLASALAATLAAQLFTLPLQMLLGPVPDWRSIPANLATTPFVDVATILGLLSLLTCRPCPALGYAFARAASMPTAVIMLLAAWLCEL